MKKIILTISKLLFCFCLFSQGTELVTDGGFSSGGTHWSVTNDWSISDDTARYVDGTYSKLTQVDGDMVSSMKANTTYTIEFDIWSDGDARFRIQPTSGGYPDNYVEHKAYTEGHYKFEFTSPADIGDGGLEFFVWDTSDDFKIDNVSLKENWPIGDSPYYVATDGNDIDSGTMTSPWATWGKAAKNAYAGDTVYFRGGIYYLTEPVSLDGGEIGDPVAERTQAAADAGKNMNSGEYGNPVCFFGYPPDVANSDSIIFDFSGNYIEEPDAEYLDSVWLAGGGWLGGVSNFGINIGWTNYFHLRDFTIRNVYQKYRYVLGHGLFLPGSSNFTIERLHIYNIGGEGIYTFPVMLPDTSYFLNIDLHNCIDSLSGNPSNYFNGNAGTRSHGYFIIPNATDSLGHQSYNVIEGCRAWYCGDDGFNVVVRGEVVMQNNWSFANGAYLPHMENPYSSGNGYKLNAQTSENQNYAHSNVQYYVTNNIAAFNQGYGYSDNAASFAPRKNRKMYNNLSILNLYGYVIKAGSLEWGYWYEDYINNIAYGHDYNLNYGGEVAITTNLTNSWTDPPNIYVTDSDFMETDKLTIINSLMAPRKADGSLPDLNTLSLSSSSKLIDAGTDVGLPYKGSAPDLGPIEHDIVPGTNNNYPSVFLNCPKNSSIFTKSSDEIIISAEVYDPDGSISAVEFFYRDTLIKQLNSPPWSISWKEAPVGRYPIRAIATDNEGAKSTSARVWITVLPGIPEEEIKNSGFLYPNPNNGFFTFVAPEPLRSNSELLITSLDGRIVFEDTMQQEEMTKEFDLSFLEAGIYIIILFSNQILLTSKFIKL